MVVKISALPEGFADRTERFFSEYSSVSKLSHKSIVNLERFILAKECSRLYLIMEHIPHGELLDWISHRGYVTERDVVVLCRQIVDAMAYVHRSGLKYRNLKPENVLINNSDAVHPVVCFLQNG